MTVVDLCCGDGYFTAPLSRIVAPGTAYAVDMDPGVLDRAREEVARHGVPENCVFVLADARELAGYIDAPADIVVLANTFHGVPDQTALSRCVREVLKPGSGFVIVNWHRLPKEQTPVLGEPRGPATGMRMSPDMVEAVVEPAGFYRERVVELPPYHYGMVFRARAPV
jgi:ubiquinone/menaquinone biosynthesis C-methylase UbiE